MTTQTEKTITIKDPSGALVPVLLAGTLEMAEGFLRDALDLKISDLASYHKASEILNSIQRFISGLDKQTLDLGRPYRDFSAEIRSRADAALNPLKTGKAALAKKATDWWNEQERIRLAEEARLADLRAEAERLQQAAIKDVVAATTEAQQDAAGEDLKAAADLKRQADNLMPATVTKVKGLKTVKKILIDSVDKCNAPAWALEVNEAAIRKAALAGSIDEDDKWLKFRIVEEIAATGR